MLPSFVTPAAASPLPEAGAPAAPSSPGEARFDEALDASLEGAAPPAAPAAAPAARRFPDPLSVAEWMLFAAPAAGPDAAPVEAAPAPTADASHEGEVDVTPTSGDVWWDIPMDVLLATPAPMQDAPLRQPEPDATTPLEITISVTPAAEQTPATDLPLQNERVGTTADAPPVDAFRVPTAHPNDVSAEVVRPAASIEAPAAVPAAPAEAGTRVTNTDDISARGDGDGPRADVDGVRTQASARTPRARANGTDDAAARTDVNAARAYAGGNGVGISAEMMGPAESRPGQIAVEPQSGRQDVSRASAPADAARAIAASPLAPETGHGDTPAFDGNGGQNQAAMRLAAALSSAAASAGDGGAAAAPVFSVPAAAAPASVAAATIVTPAGETVVVDPENVSNMVEAMRVTARNGGWEATVRLRPEHLGEVTIALRVDGSNVSATVNAESAGVRQWLMGQEESVRSGMAEHGLQLHKFEVERDGQRGREQQEPEEQPRRRQARRQQEPTDRFEIVV